MNGCQLTQSQILSWSTSAIFYKKWPEDCINRRPTVLKIFKEEADTQSHTSMILDGMPKLRNLILKCQKIKWILLRKLRIIRGGIMLNWRLSVARTGSILLGKYRRYFLIWLKKIYDFGYHLFMLLKIIARIKL